MRSSQYRRLDSNGQGAPQLLARWRLEISQSNGDARDLYRAEEVGGWHSFSPSRARILQENSRASLWGGDGDSIVLIYRAFLARYKLQVGPFESGLSLEFGV